MSTNAERYYSQIIEGAVLPNGLLPSDISYEVKVVCFFSSLKSKYNLKQVDYSSRENFVNSINANIDLVSNESPSLARVFEEIKVYDNFKYSKSFNEIDKRLDKENEDVKSSLFEYSDNYFPFLRGANSTSTQLAKAVLLLIEDKKFNTVLDLCSGEGYFLNEYSKINGESELYGYEVNYLSLLVSKMHLLMNGADAAFTQMDILGASLKDKYDLVFSEYPVALRYTEKIEDDVDQVVEYKTKSYRCDWGFIYKAINSTNKNGKTIVVAPIGTLYNLPDRVYRKEVVDKGFLEEIIFMPSGISRYTGVLYSLLVFSQSQNKNSVKLIDATKCTLNTKGALKLIDLDEFRKLVNSEDDERVKIVAYDEIKKHNYTLSLSAYSASAIKFDNPIKISEFAEVFTGFQYTSKNVLELEPGEGNIDVARITNIDNGSLEYGDLLSINIDESKVKNYLLQENDIILSAKGTTDKTALIENIDDKKIIPYNNLLVIRIINNKINPIYLYAFLNSDTGKTLLKTLESGSVIRNINKKSLLDLEIPLVDMDTQETIGNRYILLKNEIDKEKQKLDEMVNKLNSIFEDETGV